MTLSDQMQAEPSTSGCPGRSMAKWFGARKGPRAACETFLRLRSEGKTNWSVRRLLKALQAEFGFPFTSEAALGRYLQDTWPEQYERGVSR